MASDNGSDDRMRSQGDLTSELVSSETTPAVDCVPSPWNATEPTEIRLPPAMRLLGEPLTNGRPTPFLVCGYVFRVTDIVNWMDSRKLLSKHNGSPSDRADKGWGCLVNTLAPRGVSCWLVRTHLNDHLGNRMKYPCTAKSLIIGSNETKEDRVATRNKKKIELIHKVLGIPKGALGAPEWLLPAK